MKKNVIPITQDFNSSDLDKTVGFAEIRPDKLKEINKILESGKLVEFAVGFISKFPEDGVYKDAELVEISMIVKDRKEEPWKKH